MKIPNNEEDIGVLIFWSDGWEWELKDGISN